MDKITHEVRLDNWISLVEQCQSRPVGKILGTFLTDRSTSQMGQYSGGMACCGMLF